MENLQKFKENYTFLTRSSSFIKKLFDTEINMVHFNAISYNHSRLLETVITKEMFASKDKLFEGEFLFCSHEGSLYQVNSTNKVLNKVLDAVYFNGNSCVYEILFTQFELTDYAKDLIFEI